MYIHTYIFMISGIVAIQTYINVVHTCRASYIDAHYNTHARYTIPKLSQPISLEYMMNSFSILEFAPILGSLAIM